MSSPRSTRVRTKVVALLASLFALWSFAAIVTVREGVNLLWVSLLDTNLGRPTEALMLQMERERRLSMVYVGGGTSAQREELLGQRATTDEAINQFETLSEARGVDLAASDALKAQVAAARELLGGLQGIRENVDNRGMTLAESATAFNDLIDACFVIYSSLSNLDDRQLAREADALILLVRAREILSREDALVSGVLATGEWTSADHERIAQLIGVRRFLHAEVQPRLWTQAAADLRELLAGPSFTHLQQLEDEILAYGGSSSAPPMTLSAWSTASTDAFTEVRQLEENAADDFLVRATPAATWTIVRLILAGGLGLIAVIASIVISITTARALVRQLERLRNAARELASYRLPRVVERLQHGEKVDVDQEAPPLDFGLDEIGQVGQAFNAVQETAVRVAVEQAELRRSVRDVFLSLARRSQALLHRQLGLLDAMERRATDAEELSELFRVDHLATRMRRNAENLIVLSGATAGRAWRRPVPMIDVMRGALAEVEDYTRVNVAPVGSASLVGRAVGDVIHLLAELIENAVSFSPPQTSVRIGGSVVGNGFAIEIEDRGLGMTPEEREAANDQLRNPPDFKLSSTARLGLYVVGKLAERHGVRVRLTESAYGGTTAIVLLPNSLISEESTDEVIRLEATTSGSAPPPEKRSLATVGRHRIDAPVLASRTHASQQSPDNDLPLFNHVMQGGLSAAVPNTTTTAPPPDQSSGPASPDSAASTRTPAADPAVSAPAAPVEPKGSESQPTRLTPSGLPWRQRPAPAKPAASPSADTAPPPAASMAAAPGPSSSTAPVTSSSAPGEGLAAAASGAPAGSSDGPRPARGLEASRSMMASYRSGTLRGRTEAARLAQDSSPAPERTPPAQPAQPAQSAPPAQSARPQQTAPTAQPPQESSSTEDGG